MRKTNYTMSSVLSVFFLLKEQLRITFDPNCLIFSYSHYVSFSKKRYLLKNGRRTSFRFMSIFFFKLKYSLTDYFPMFPLCTFLMFSTGTENKKVTLGSNGLILLNWDLNCDQSAKNCGATLLKRLQDFLFSGGIKRWYWAVLG